IKKKLVTTYFLLVFPTMRIMVYDMENNSNNIIGSNSHYWKQSETVAQEGYAVRTNQRVSFKPRRPNDHQTEKRDDQPEKTERRQERTNV
ncbi:hypothetical protein U1Q18_001813, partial [Sarracenia purpurea var. burkii]